MKKPIDPNLNDIFNIDVLDTSESKLSAPVDTNSTTEQVYDTTLTLNETVKSNHHHHHHHHSSEHNSSTHHSSGHHSSSHHSSGHQSSGHHSSSHHHSSKRRHHSSKKKKSKLSIASKIAIIFLAVILILIIAVVGGFLYLQQKGKNDIKNVTTQTSYDEVIEYNGHKYAYNPDVVSIAFIGVDKRELGNEGIIGNGGQADADLVLTVNTKTGRSKVIAVPRDTMVDVDLYSENGIFLRTENMQLCLSFAYGDGKETSAENVTTSISRILYNIPMNKYFVLDLDGIAPINDAVGGVTVESLYDFDDLGIRKGDTIHLHGDMTETYVRLRNMDTVDASLNRTARQVQYIKAFAAQAMPAVVNDFSVISRLYNTASSYSTTNMDLSNVTYLASRLLSKGISDFETTTLQGKMVESDRVEYLDYVYAEFYPDKDSTLETVLDTFYTQVD